MGLNLSLGIIKYTAYYDNWDKWLGHERLELDRDYNIFDKFKDFEQLNEDNIPVFNLIKNGFTYIEYRDKGIKEIKECINGMPLTYTKVKYIKEKLKKPKFLYTTEWNCRVLEFICSLPDETCIVLEWS
ncbi:MAG: hypothetical protein ACOCRO_10715 [Halanaerobiales bacterium]